VRRRQGQPGRGHKERARDVERIEPASQKAGQEGVTMAAKSKRRKIKVMPYDSADYLKTEADIKNYLEAVFEEPMDRQMQNIDIEMSLPESRRRSRRAIRL
jgi:hypothetical protein